MSIKRSEFSLVNRAGTQYTAALRYLALLPEAESADGRRKLFECFTRCIVRMQDMTVAFRGLHPSATPAENLLGAARFNGALAFVKEQELDAFGYAIVIADGLLGDNLVPLQEGEERELKRRGSPLVRNLHGVPYRLFSERPITRFYAQRIQVSFARIRERWKLDEEERRRTEQAIQGSVSAHDILATFRGVFAAPVGRDGYLELHGDGREITVVKASGVFEIFQGRSFGKRKLPIRLYRELQSRGRACATRGPERTNVQPICLLKTGT